MPLPAKHFYMIRHGETEANRDRIMAGSMDSPLTDNGRNQAQSVQDIVLKLEIRPSIIVHSNLSRARETARIINEALNVPIYEDPDLAELHAGDWEGVPYEVCDELLTGWPTPPNGETFTDFCSRIKRGKINNLSKHEGPILIVSHGGVFRGLGGIYGLHTPGIFKNCHLYEFQPADIETFPWHVWSYEECGTRLKSEVFHQSKILKCA